MAEDTGDTVVRANDKRTIIQNYVKRIEALQETMDESKADQKEVYKEAGFATRWLRNVIRERKLDPEVRAEKYAAEDEFRLALGMLADTPLGEAAEAAEPEAAE